ncbi:uncharacterized protein LOC135495368 isoform X2 [Lineus longissimus]|uniref:uncharacterized protein LOC135495368 isoform X2 n=1 Tax=Lineus longissimus TaxID=88925 RepID=UPI00315CC889
MGALGFLSVIIVVLLLDQNDVDAKFIKSYTMPSLDCSPSIREIDGAVIYSANKLQSGVAQDTKCELRFSNADGTLLSKKRLAIRFEQVDIKDCHVELWLFAGRSANARLLQKLDCNSTTPTEVFESGEAVTIELITGNADPDKYHFRFLVTSYEKSGFCDEMTCNNGRCISKDLACDSFDSCFDGSDELKGQPSYCKAIVSPVLPPPGADTATVGAKGKNGTTVQHTYIIPFEMWLIGLIIIIILLIIAIIICIICCIRRSKGRDGFGRPTSTGTTSAGYQASPSGPPAAANQPLAGQGLEKKPPSFYADGAPSAPEYAPY